MDLTPSSSTRKKLALKNIIRRHSQAPERAPVDLAQLVRVYLLDGSSKVLQMKDSSTARNVLEQLKFNMDLPSIKTFTLYRVCGSQFRRVELDSRIKDVLREGESEGEEVRLLLRSWICDECGPLEKEAMQEGSRAKVSNSALWLKYLEAVFSVLTGKCYLTEDEAMLLGCLKMQADSGDYRSEFCSQESLQERISTSFPDPVRSRMEGYCSDDKRRRDLTKAVAIATRAQLLYSRLAGYSKPEAQIEFIRTLRTWCPFYGAAFFSADCQYDDAPADATNEPPVIRMTAAVTDKGIYLITSGSPPIILRQPYSRIVKWTTHTDMNIFCFWVLKEKYQLRDILALQQRYTESDGSNVDSPDDFDPNRYCDCIYLVCEEVDEIDFLVRCNVDMRKTGRSPLLPGDSPDEDDSEADEEPPGGTQEGNRVSEATDSSQSGIETSERQNAAPAARRTSVLNVFFKALSGAGGEEEEMQSDLREGQGVGDADFEQPSHSYGDDTSSLASSVFRATDDQPLRDLDMVLASSMDNMSALVSSGGPENTPEPSTREYIRNAPRRTSLFRWASMSS